MAAPPPNEQLAMTVADGNDVALGSTADSTSDNTVIGRLKNFLSRLPAALTASGNLKTALQEALPAGTNTIGGAFPIPSATHGASIAACAAAGTTTAKSTAGVLKALWIAGTGTAGTVTVTDGSTDLFVAGIPAAVGTWSVPLPPEGASMSTSIKVTTAGAGVTAAAVYV